MRTHQCLGNCMLLEKPHLINPNTTSAFLIFVIAMVLMQSVNLSKYSAVCLIILSLKLCSTVFQSSWAPADGASQIFLFLLSRPKRRMQAPNCHCQMSYYLLTSLGCHNFYYNPTILFSSSAFHSQSQIINWIWGYLWNIFNIPFSWLYPSVFLIIAEIVFIV